MPIGLHVVSVADEKYARYMLAMIASAMASAANDVHIDFHILGDGFSPETVSVYEKFVREGGHSLHWLRDTSADAEIPLTMYFSRAASLRLFLAEMLPDVDKAAYLDADTIVCGDGMRRLAEVDLGGRALGVVADADIIFKYMARATGITDPTYRYFNSGVMVINLAKWRREGATEKHLRVLRARQGKMVYVDQDVLNICWKDDLMYLPLNFNVTSPAYAFGAKFLEKRRFGAPYYTAPEIEDARRNPYVLHFIGYTMARPWKAACYHPKKQLFIDAANATPYGYRLEKSTPSEMYKYTRIRVLRDLEPRFLRLFWATLARVKWFVLGLAGRKRPEF